LGQAAQQEELLLSSTTANASLAQELRAADAQLALQRQQLDAALSREEEIKKECEHWQEMLQRKEDELAEERRRFQECVAEQESASKAAAEGFKSREDEIGDLRQQVTVLEASLRESKVKLAVVEVGEADALGRLQREVEDRRAQVSLQEQAHSEALSKHQRAAADMEQQLSRMRQRLEDEGTRLREAQARVDMLQEANKDLQAAAQSACSLQVAVDKKDQQLARSDKIIEKLMADVATLKAN
jgi:DNA repair exonuclease SbcCD ATPase subunit